MNRHCSSRVGDGGKLNGGEGRGICWEKQQRLFGSYDVVRARRIRFEVVVVDVVCVRRSLFIPPTGEVQLAPCVVLLLP